MNERSRRSSKLWVLGLLCGLLAWDAQATPSSRPASRPVAGSSAVKVSRKPVVRPRSKAIVPLGLVVLPNAGQTLKQLLVWQQAGFAPEAQKLYRKASRKLRRFFPAVRGLSLHQLLRLLPGVLAPFGVQADRPMGVIVWRYYRRMVPVFVVTIDKARLLRSLRLAGLHPQLVVRDGVETVYLGEGKPASPLGVILGNRLYFSMLRVPRRRGLFSRHELEALLREVAALKTPMRSLLHHAGYENVWMNARARGKDVIVALTRLRALPLPPKAALLRRLVQGLGFSISLQQGLWYELRIKGRPESKVFLDVLASNTTLPAGWMKLLPARVGWMSSSKLDLPALFTLLTKGPKPGLLSMGRSLQWRFFSALVQTQARALGVDLAKAHKDATGRMLSGFVWGRSMRSRMMLWRRQMPFLGHMQGVFFALEFHKKEGPTTWMQTLQKAHASVGKTTSHSLRQLSLKPLTHQGFKMLALNIPLARTMYLVAKDNWLIFLGDARTRDHFLKVWSGKAPSLANRQAHKGWGRAFSGIATHFTLLHPRVLRQLQHLLPPASRPKISPWIHRIRHWQMFSSRNKLTLRTGMELVLSSKATVAKAPALQPPTAFVAKRPPSKKPMRSLAGVAVSLSFAAAPLSNSSIGVLAAIAIPSFVRFTRRAKTSEAVINLRAIGNGAITWFDDEHADAQGNPMPKHFPCTGKGWICTPSQAPCASGKAYYPRNTAQWNHTCWLQLKFSIPKRHSFRYCYKSEGTGAKARFTVRAHADLDCDGRLSTYQVNATVHPATGEVLRSRLQRKDPLE